MTVPFILSLAILFGLTLFLFHEVRRSSRGPRWKKSVRITLVAIPLLVCCFFFWGILVEPNRLVLHQETIAIANWPPELDGLKIAVLSDLHIGGCGTV